jgi:hypothetical protein
MWGETPFVTPSSSSEKLAASSLTDREREKGKRGTGEDLERTTSQTYTRSEEWDGRTQGIGMKEQGDVIAEGIST